MVVKTIEWRVYHQLYDLHRRGVNVGTYRGTCNFRHLFYILYKKLFGVYYGLPYTAAKTLFYNCNFVEMFKTNAVDFGY